MSKKGWACVVLVAFLAAVGLAIAAGAPDTVTLDKAKDKQTPVVFNHKKHVDEIKVDCKVCHHKDADPKAKASSCFSCHKATGDEKNPAAKDAFHGKCVTCHKEKGGNAPTKCTDCHKK